MRNADYGKVSLHIDTSFNLEAIRLQRAVTEKHLLRTCCIEALYIVGTMK